jgi:hypothetical protein
MTHPMTMEEEGRVFYEAIGKGITEWTTVEDMLYLIFLGCLSPADHQMAAAAFYATDSFRAKLRMIESLVIQVFGIGSTEQEEWSRLRKYIERNAAPKRNELAHWQVLIDGTQRPGRRYTLRNQILNPRSLSIFDSSVGLGVNELQFRVKRFCALASRIRSLHQRIGQNSIYYVRSTDYVRTRGEV